MQTTYKASNILVRVIYCLCLIYLGVVFFNGSKEILFLLQTPRQFGFMNLIGVVIHSLPTILMLFLVVFRFFSVILGKNKLNLLNNSGGIYSIRIIAVLLMALSVFPWLLSLGGAQVFGGVIGFFAFLYGNIGGGAMAGIVLFEATRLIEREVALEKT